MLALLDSGQAADFRNAFAIVMHERGIFHGHPGHRETYNVYFRKIRPLVTTALNARRLPKRKVRQVPEGEPRRELYNLFRTGKLSGFTPDP